MSNAFNIPTSQPEAAGLRNMLASANARRKEPLPSRVEKEKYFIFNCGPFAWARQTGVLGTKYVKACENGEEYMLACVIREYEYEYYEAGNQQLNHRQWNGLDLAKDFLGILPPAHADNDLTRMGVFLSESNPPKERDIEAAREKLEKYCQELCLEGDMMANGDDASKLAIRNSGKHKIAAKYIGYEADWCTLPKLRVPCPACGVMMPKGAAVHTDPNCNAIIDEAKARKFYPHLFAQEEKPPRKI